VNTASATGLVGLSGASAYVAAKHGDAGLTKTAALEFAQKGIRVNAVCPGFIRTPMVERGLDKGSSPSSPCNRMGKTDEIAEAVPWLCSDASSFVTWLPMRRCGRAGGQEYRASGAYVAGAAGRCNCDTARKTANFTKVLAQRHTVVDWPRDRHRDDRASSASVTKAAGDSRVDSAAGEAGAAIAGYSVDCGAAFANLGSDPQQDYFSDGISDQLINNLSRLPGLFVIARNSSFAYKGKPTKRSDIGKELGVKYGLEGSVHKEADKVRTGVELVDASTGTDK